MARKRSSVKRNKPPTNNNNGLHDPGKNNILQTNRLASYAANTNDTNHNSVDADISIAGLGEIKSILEPTDVFDQPGASTSNENNLNTAALYDELDSFRLRWKRELGAAKKPNLASAKIESNNIPSRKSKIYNNSLVDQEDKENKETSTTNTKNELSKSDSSDKIYSKARELFLKAVDLERDEMHLESIRYYKEAMHLCPDIEKRIFKEQCAASIKENAKLLMEQEKLKQQQQQQQQNGNIEEIQHEPDKRPVYERVRDHFHESNKAKGSYKICRPNYKTKSTHISDLPQELIRKLLFYVVGQELDLASLECMAMTCRGFYLLARDPLLWKSICTQTWGNATELLSDAFKEDETNQALAVDWRRMYIERPRINFDGVYISRTRYIRQGDVGFQDLTYRPFHIVRYYRYLRFFPDGRVLILTTNEEPDKIVPIFRHATRPKQFSSDLSVLEGSYEFLGTNEIHIHAEKDCAINPIQRRQPQYWSRQTPISQELNLKFELRTVETKPHKNNILKWMEYTLLTKLETGQELESFDLTYDMFPNLIFYRVKRFNIRSTKALVMCW